MLIVDPRTHMQLQLCEAAANEDKKFDFLEKRKASESFQPGLPPFL
jgi:hypothetical protein